MDRVETGSFASTRTGAEQPQFIRVVSWNVNRGCNLKEIVDYLESADSDLVLLQETDVDARRSGYRNIAGEIAEKLRLNYVFGREFQELSQGTPTAPAYHGQATLSRWPLSQTRVLRFRNQSGFWRPRWYIPPLSLFQRRLGGRIALVCEVLIGRVRLLTYNLHLESRGNDQLRQEQLREVLEDSRQTRDDVPALIAGDFNFDLRCSAVAKLLSGVKFENPFYSANGNLITARTRFGRGLSIDSILTRDVPTAQDATIASMVTASDHFPLTLTLRLNGASLA
jgi:endonuclease/exonuclease/phosphatase family metal-dependent hydrolase